MSFWSAIRTHWSPIRREEWASSLLFNLSWTCASRSNFIFLWRAFQLNSYTKDEKLWYGILHIRFFTKINRTTQDDARVGLARPRRPRRPRPEHPTSAEAHPGAMTNSGHRGEPVQTKAGAVCQLKPQDSSRFIKIHQDSSRFIKIHQDSSSPSYVESRWMSPSRHMLSWQFRLVKSIGALQKNLLHFYHCMRLYLGATPCLFDQLLVRRCLSCSCK